MLAVEIPVDALDESVENRTQVMPQNESILNFLIIMNVSLISAALAVELHWASGPTAIQHATYGWQSWVVNCFQLDGACAIRTRLIRLTTLVAAIDSAELVAVRIAHIGDV